MIAAIKDSVITPDQYLVWEAEQDRRYEYEYGEVIAMTGGTIPHSQISANLATLLNIHLRGKKCKILVSDAKVVILNRSVYYYPDLSVTCDERDRSAREFIQYPCLIAEVISPSTESRDRGVKFNHYRRIPTLQDYLIIDSDRPSVEHFYKNERQNWELIHVYTDELNFDNFDPEVKLISVDLHFSLSSLYENIEF